MTLKALTVKQAKSGDKPYKLADEKGMYLLVTPRGGKCWRLKYRYAGKEKTLALGIFPDVALDEARSARDIARKQLAQGVDPGEVKKAEKATKRAESSSSFSLVAREWWNKQSGVWSEDHAARVLKSLEDDVFPDLGQRPVMEIDATNILATLKKVEGRGALDYAGRVLQRVAAVFRYAVQTGRIKANPASDLQGTLKTRKVRHQPSLARNELPHFLKALSTYNGKLQTRFALKLLVLTFVRPGELRYARWSELDLKSGEWRIPAERMKMKTEHLVPLSKQAILVLENLKPITGQYDLVFPGERNCRRPISENTLGVAIKRMGFAATAHGFRATASSILNEQGFNRDAIERQLSHLERNKVRGAYTHHAEYLNERKKMMQWWADYMDSRLASNVVQLKRGV